MPRLFVGTPLAPDLDTQPVLKALEGIGRVKPVDPGQYHVTLAFIGDVDDAEVKAAREAVRAGATGPAHTGTVQTVGAFPKPSQARVVWAGIEGAHLDALARSVRSELAARDLPYDERAFHAHLTIARLRDKRDVTSVTKRFQGTTFGELPVPAVHLYRSTLTSEGPEYEIVERASLEGEA